MEVFLPFIYCIDKSSWKCRVAWRFLHLIACYKHNHSVFLHLIAGYKHNHSVCSEKGSQIISSETIVKNESILVSMKTLMFPCFIYLFYSQFETCVLKACVSIYARQCLYLNTSAICNLNYHYVHLINSTTYMGMHQLQLMTLCLIQDNRNKTYSFCGQLP